MCVCVCARARACVLDYVGVKGKEQHDTLSENSIFRVTLPHFNDNICTKNHRQDPDEGNNVMCQTSYLSPPYLKTFIPFFRYTPLRNQVR